MHVAGSLTLENSSGTGNAWTYYKNADRTWLVGVRGSSNDALSFYDLTTDVERLRITSDGKLGIKVTSPGCQTGGIHAVHDATEGTPSFTGGEVGIFQRNYNSAQGCEIGIIGGSNSYSRINFGDKDDADIGIISYSHNDNSMRLLHLQQKTSYRI